MNPETQISIIAPQLGPFLVLLGLALGGVSLPLALGWIRKNGWYGVRIPKAFESESNWYSINRVGGRWMLGGGLILMALGAWAIYFPPAHSGALVLLALAPFAIIVATLASIFRFAGRLP